MDIRIAVPDDAIALASTTRLGFESYREWAPEGWQPPAGLRLASPRRSRAGREAQWTLIGEPDEVTARLAGAGATVRDVTPLSLEEAALAFLAEEGAA